MPKKPDDEFIEWATEEWSRSREHSKTWREIARRCYDYKAGDQWSDADIAKMEEDERPVISFNRISAYTDAVSGIETNNRHEVKFLPREENDQAGVDVLNATAKWARDGCDAEDEESDAFEDLVVVGMGHTDISMAFDEDPDGKIIIERMDPLEIYWDPSAKKKNIVDARWKAQLRSFHKEEFEERWPDAKELGDPSILGFSDFDEDLEQAMVIDGVSREINPRKGKIRVLRFQYFTLDPFFRVALPDPTTGEVTLQEVSVSGFNRMKEVAEITGEEAPRAIKQKRRTYYQAYISGTDILEHDLLPSQAGFTIQSMTGRRHRNKNTWDGIVKNMLDPQDFGNKYFAQMHDLFNSQVKGGIWFEDDAVDDAEDFEKNATKPNAIVRFKAGALSNNKVQKQIPPPIPASLVQLHEFTINSLPSVSGINPELLGLTGRDQPGVLENTRKAASMSILAGFFQALRRYRKEHGRVLAYFMANFIPDGRKIRIMNEDRAKFIPFTKQPGFHTYDVVVADSPSSPNQKERSLAIITELGRTNPEIAKSLLPHFIDNLPLPADMIANVKKGLQEASEPSQEQQIAQQLELAKLASEAFKNFTAADLNTAKAEMERDGIALSDTKVMTDFLARNIQAIGQTRSAQIAADGRSNQQPQQAQ